MGGWQTPPLDNALALPLPLEVFLWPFDCSLPVLLVLTFDFPPDFVVLLVEVAFSDRSARAGRDVGVLEVVTTEAGHVQGYRFSIFWRKVIRSTFWYNVMIIVCVCSWFCVHLMHQLCLRNECFGLLAEPFNVQCSVAFAGYIPSFYLFSYRNPTKSTFN